MSHFKPSLDDILNGKNLETSCTAEANPIISRTVPPEPMLGETGGVDPVAGSPVKGEQNSGESPLAEIVAETQTEQPVDVFAVDTEPVLQKNQPIQYPGQQYPVPSEFSVVQVSIGHIEQDVSSIADSAAKTAREVREMHKLYHNEFANRLKSMQDELERYHEIDKGRIFDGILGEVAKLYSDNESVLEDIADPKIRKRISYMLMDIVQILEANGVSRQKSNPKDKRNTRYCQVVERIITGDPDLHDTIALSRNTGFYIENRALIKELVDIYLYSEKTDEQLGEI